MNLRLVPESELLAPTRTASNSSAPSGPASSPEKAGKAPHAHAHPQRAVKKKRTTTETAAPPAQLISPTLLTWVVSAGVVVIFSVVGFGAGYVIGREVGRQEGGAALWPSGGGGGTGNVTTLTSSCGRELASSGTGGALRRLRWGVGGGKGVVA